MSDREATPSWTVQKLKTELKKRGLSISGRKDDLIKRFNEDSPDANGVEESPSQQRKRSSAAAVKKPSSQLTNQSKKSQKSRQKQLVDPIEELSFAEHPLKTFYYFGVALQSYLRQLVHFLAAHRSYLAGFLALAGGLLLAGNIESPYQPLVRQLAAEFFWYGYWVLLGVASSIGLGTGLHTFVLFLGPLIAEVVVFAYECPSMAFQLHGPDAFVCLSSKFREVSLLAIYRKIMFEALFWGAGTAIGELPPYFVARTAALAGRDLEDLDEIEQLRKRPVGDRTIWERVKLVMFEMINRFGFIGILVCASVPNPLFDLAGITCGHFLVPFSTFFGATFIGKAFFKASIQAWSIIFIFSKGSIDLALKMLANYTPRLYGVASKFLAEQRESFSPKSSKNAGSGSLIGSLWNTVITVMILYFVQSIIVSLANQAYKKSKARSQ